MNQDFTADDMDKNSLPVTRPILFHIQANRALHKVGTRRQYA